MVSVSSLAHTLASQTSKKATNIKNITKGVGFGGLMTGAFCLLDFTQVPDAFKIKYNEDGEKVEGLNYKAGFKEIGKSAIKCASYMAIPTAILAAASGWGLVAAGLAGAASFGSTFALSNILEKVLPSETTLIAEACKKKGINIEAA